MLRLLLGIVLIGHSQGFLQSDLRPLELSLLQEATKSSIVSFRQTQHHKGLSREPGHYVIEKPRKLRADMHQEIQILAYENDVVWAQARLMCDGDITDDESVLPLVANTLVKTNQRVLSNNPLLPDETYWKGHAPPLQIELLIESGPSANRVDLVFFSDGCTLIQCMTRYLT